LRHCAAFIIPYNLALGTACWAIFYNTSPIGVYHILSYILVFLIIVSLFTLYFRRKKMKEGYTTFTFWVGHLGLLLITIIYLYPQTFFEALIVSIIITIFFLLPIPKKSFLIVLYLKLKLIFSSNEVDNSDLMKVYVRTLGICIAACFVAILGMLNIYPLIGYLVIFTEIPLYFFSGNIY